MPGCFSKEKALGVDQDTVLPLDFTILSIQSLGEYKKPYIEIILLESKNLLLGSDKGWR